MSREDSSVIDAKKSIKSHIKFLEGLLTHLNGPDVVFKGRAMWAAWCLHHYINGRLADDIKAAMLERIESAELKESDTGV